MGFVLWDGLDTMARRTLVLVAMLAAAAGAQTAPAAPRPDPVVAWFATGTLPDLALTLDEAAAAQLQANPRAYVRATLREAGVEAPLAVGVKLKGTNGSFRPLDDRPGLTIDVDRFAKDATFHGL